MYNYLNVVFQRYIQNEDLSSLSKEGLVELYYSYVLPLPQRKYRLNRRGKEMTKKQIVMAKKRKISTTDDSEPPKKSVNRSFAHFWLNSKITCFFSRLYLELLPLYIFLPYSVQNLNVVTTCEFSKKKKKNAMELSYDFFYKFQISTNFLCPFHRYHFSHHKGNNSFKKR